MEKDIELLIRRATELVAVRRARLTHAEQILADLLALLMADLLTLREGEILPVGVDDDEAKEHG